MVFGNEGCPLFSNACIDLCGQLGHKAGFCGLIPGMLIQYQKCYCRDWLKMVKNECSINLILFCYPHNINFVDFWNDCLL